MDQIIAANTRPELLRCEQLEAQALRAMHEVASPSIRARLGLELIDHDGCLVSIAGKLPSTAVLINRALMGNGSAGALSLTEVQLLYHARGVNRYFLHQNLRHPPVPEDALSARALRRQRGWQKFEHDLHSIHPASSELRVRRLNPQNIWDFGLIVGRTFALGEEAVPWLSELVWHPNWYIFMSYEGHIPAGVAALFVEGKYGWLDFAATRPEMRRLGSQQVLLAHRLNFARTLGCTQLFSCTGEALPDFPQQSYRNLLRAGFKETYLRENYAPQNC
ncbi:GNAT family N-acetyltransferase [Bowmanella dokdonensis]|uniref:N-acetyltransferase domain-containing protein n=1 Tax=Bowmanella dokdonensis TaxID=751969 RepID=A0A939IP11_9ALTE|nr:hypothetical protein [Bowmanella dokdonensis]MBN7825405.1 hypothetical protein [Bowmanella dokdonensis]